MVTEATQKYFHISQANKNLQSKGNLFVESNYRSNKQESGINPERLMLCRAGAGRRDFCFSSGPDWKGSGAWTLINPRFSTSASLLQIQQTFLKTLRPFAVTCGGMK